MPNNPTWRIRVVFADRVGPRDYTAPDIRHLDPGWGDEILNRTIERLEFFLPTGHKIVMTGMEYYNFFVEAVQSLSSDACGIKAFWFAGKLPGCSMVNMWRIGDGKVVHIKKVFGQEWGGLPTRGWKKGLVGGPVSSDLVRI